MYAVLFDIDGTLLQTGGAGQLAFAEAFAEQFNVSELSDEIAFAGRSDRAIALDLMRVHGVAADETNWGQFYDNYLNRLPAALSRRKGRVLPGVNELIAALRVRKHVLMGLLTGNVRAGARAKLAHYGLSDEFDFGGFGDDAIDRNDIAAAALAEAERRLQGVNGANHDAALCGAMVIGDTVHDVRCARSIGAFAVAVPTGGTPAEALYDESPDLLLENLQEHQAILDAVDEVLQTLNSK